MKSANKITYESFTQRVANRAKVSEAEADAYIHQFSKTTGEALEDGDEVQLYRFGRFVTVHADERPGHNPRTGDAITIPEHMRVNFHPYQALLAAVNWPFRHLRTRMLSENKTDTGPSALIWLLLLLGLLVLLLIGFTINREIFGRDSEPAKPVASSINMESSLSQANPVVASQAPVLTEDASNRADSASTQLNVATTMKTIVVNKGDTLWGIAASQWGDASWWPVIYAENRAELTQHNPDLIQTASTLHLPVLAGSVTQPTDADLKLKTNAYRIVADDYTRTSNKRAAEYRVVAARGFGHAGN